MGDTRILGALSNLGIQLDRGTIQRILKDHLLEPAPIRMKRISWSSFLKAHWRGLAASDFFTVEVWSLKGLLTVYVPLVIDLPTRRISICGMTTQPDESWMLQMSRNLLDPDTGLIRDKKHLIVDRDTKYSAAWRSRDSSDRSRRMPIQAHSNWSADATQLVARVRRSLSLGAQSPRDRESNYRSDRGSRTSPRICRFAAPTRRTSELLLPHRGLTSRELEH